MRRDPRLHRPHLHRTIHRKPAQRVTIWPAWPLYKASHGRVSSESAGRNGIVRDWSGRVNPSTSTVNPSTSPAPSDEDGCRRAAAQLQHEHERWLVMWGCYTRAFIAFPLFAAPPGTILTAAAPAEMAAKMSSQERSAGVRVPRPTPPADGRGAADWQPDPDRAP